MKNTECVTLLIKRGVNVSDQKSTAKCKMLVSKNFLTFHAQMSNVEKEKRDRRTDK